CARDAFGNGFDFW
nr:immunoglobulin heavy chain junction region [Macaca mulatta]